MNLFGRFWEWCCTAKVTWYKQALGRRALLWLIALIAGLVLVRIYGGDNRHSFGHPGLVDAATLGLLILMFGTHVVIASIMYLQRERWLPSDAAMFLFIAVKAMLWFDIATTYVSRGSQRLDIIYLYVAILITTLHLDYRMVRRYLFGTKDEQEFPEWDGTTERRVGPKDRRIA